MVNGIPTKSQAPSLQECWWNSVFPLLAEKPTADMDIYEAIAAEHAPQFLQGNSDIRFWAVLLIQPLAKTNMHSNQEKEMFSTGCLVAYFDSALRL